MVDFVLMFYREKPVDWLMDHLLFTKVCNPEKDMKECASEKRKIKVRIETCWSRHHNSLDKFYDPTNLLTYF